MGAKFCHEIASTTCCWLGTTLMRCDAMRSVQLLMWNATLWVGKTRKTTISRLLVLLQPASNGFHALAATNEQQWRLSLLTHQFSFYLSFKTLQWASRWQHDIEETKKVTQTDWSFFAGSWVNTCSGTLNVIIHFANSSRKANNIFSLMIARD